MGEKRMKAKKYLLFFLLGYCIYIAIEVYWGLRGRGAGKASKVGSDRKRPL